MRILLLLDEIYLPSFGGGTKACRLLLEDLVKRGHECHVLAPSLVSVAQAGPTGVPQFLAMLKARGIDAVCSGDEAFCFSCGGVEVEAHDFPQASSRLTWLEERLRLLQPDCILISEDKRKDMMRTAMRVFPERIVLLLQTLSNLPFGPLSREADPERANLLGAAAGVVVISRFQQDYIRKHAGLATTLLRLPVYGEGPFPMLADHDGEFVTLVNPCVEKGLPVFLALARAFPQVAFAAVPTWGANATVLAALETAPNVTCLDPHDDIEVILRRTRLLLAPSLWPETFGYIVVEAMLRGIPVLASDVGGLSEAKLGTDYLLPVRPAELCDTGYASPPQDIAAWAEALKGLLDDADLYWRCARRSKQAADAFHTGVTAADFEQFLADLMLPKEVRGV